MKYRTRLAALLLSFLLGTHNGYIALWESGSTEPLKVFPYRTEMLPKTDQEALSEGIRIDSSLKLAEYLQDYLS